MPKPLIGSGWTGLVRTDLSTRYPQVLKIVDVDFRIVVRPSGSQGEMITKNVITGKIGILHCTFYQMQVSD